MTDKVREALLEIKGYADRNEALYPQTIKKLWSETGLAAALAASETLPEQIIEIDEDGRVHVPLVHEDKCTVAASDLRAKLEALRELSEKATAGPWQDRHFCSPPDTAYIVDSQRHLLIGAAKQMTPIDCAFIVACVNTIRAILEGK